MATVEQRNSVIGDSLSRADRSRVEGVAELHARVVTASEASDLSLPSSVLARTITCARSRLWIDSIIGAVAPLEADWLRRLRGLTDVPRIVPAGMPDWLGVSLVSAVDPLDEAGLAARAVSGALEEGVAARDIVVVVPGSALGRYSALLGMGLEAIGVAHDGEGSDSLRVASTRVGRLMVSVSYHQRLEFKALTFDHVRQVISVGALRDDGGEVVDRSRLRTVWKSLRGIDPRAWPTVEVECPDQAALGVVRTVASSLTVVARSDSRPQWCDLAAALSGLLSGRSWSGPDGVARAQLVGLLERWADRAGSIGWEEARDELTGFLEDRSGQRSAGIRIVPLSAAWALAPEVAIVVGLADDMIPGVTGPVGPLTSDEAVALTLDPTSAGSSVDHDGKLLDALIRVSGRVQVSYPRSDRARTITREPSRHLPDLKVTVFGSVEAQRAGAASGTLGLLGATDAATSLMAAGREVSEDDGLLGRSLSAVVACNESRISPPIPGAVDAFNGGLQGLEPHLLDRLSPDARSDGTKSASPSALEQLLACPINWWAARIMKADEPDQWDPPEMDAKTRGSWIHQAIYLLAHRLPHISALPSTGQTRQALWDAVGGSPDAETISAHADPDLLGFRFRLTPGDVDREVRTVTSMIRRLSEFLTDRGTPGAGREESLGPLELDLVTGPLGIGGRVDRIDEVGAGRIVVTDFKTGQAGSGFQLAVYAWLRLTATDGVAQLLYATAAGVGRPYRPQVLLGEEDPLRWYSRAELEEYLVDRLTDPVRDAMSGQMFGGAASQEHGRYCLLCTDVVAAKGGFGNELVGRRSRALQESIATEDPLATEVEVSG